LVQAMSFMVHFLLNCYKGFLWEKRSAGLMQLLRSLAEDLMVNLQYQLHPNSTPTYLE
jgi:hypothetical protein